MHTQLSKLQILVVNSGSSSIKFSLVNPESAKHLLSASIDRLGTEQAVLEWIDDGQEQKQALGMADHQTGMACFFEWLRERMGEGWAPTAIGHRMVHGGESFKHSCVIDDESLGLLEACVPTAPLHNPVNLLGIYAARSLFPDLAQIAVLDTAFHQTMPPRAYLYPIPYELYEKHGIRRYGFHGTSHRYVCEEAARQLGKPIAECNFISAHLGNGCSAAAIKGGQCVDTTMGLTPLEGLVMGTRSGDVDPSLHNYLASNLDMSLQEVTDMLNQKSGLLGLSGLSNDMRELIAASEAGHARATLAVEIFCYRLAKAIAALMVPVGTLDGLIFTGGIGTYSEVVRTRVLALLDYLKLSEKVLVIKTDEELMIARETQEALELKA